MSELNDPRVYFAAERTALAWNRTALTLMAFGFAIERFGLFMTMLIEKSSVDAHAGPSFWFGLIFIALGGFFSLAAAAQYKNLLKTFKKHIEIPAEASPMLAIVLNVLIAGLAVVMLVYLLCANLI